MTEGGGRNCGFAASPHLFSVLSRLPSVVCRPSSGQPHGARASSVPFRAQVRPGKFDERPRGGFALRSPRKILSGRSLFLHRQRLGRTGVRNRLVPTARVRHRLPPPPPPP